MTGAYYTAEVVETVKKNLVRFWARNDNDAAYLAEIIARNAKGRTLESKVEVTRIAVVEA